jgi:TM2 domain-containing membrane protein YozV
MKVSYKAALLSAFVFPGVGQLYLKKYWRGFALVLFVFAGLGYMIRVATASALSVLDDAVVRLQNGTTDLQDISGVVGSKTSYTDPYYDAVLYFVICLWIFAIIDAYIIGKQKDSQHEEIK